MSVDAVLPGASPPELYKRLLHTFAEALAVTPADELSRFSHRRMGRNHVRRATKREVLIDGMTAAADLLAVVSPTREPQPRGSCRQSVT